MASASPQSSLFGPSFIGLSDQVKIHGEFRPKDAAFIQADRVIDWQTFNARANQIAHELISRGVRPGDRVSMIFGCEIEAMEVVFGIWRAGAAFVPLSYMLTPGLIASMISDAEAKLVIASSKHSELAVEAAKNANVPTVVSGPEWEESRREQSPKAPSITIDPDGLANIIYSSGTTGTPKGIPHTHRARVNFVSSVSTVMGYTPQSIGFLAIPPYSNGSLLTWAPTTYFGAPTILMPKFDVDDLFGAIARWKPTHGFIVPTMCTAILDHPDAETAGLDCFECAVTAGAPMPASVKQEMRRLTKDGLGELWGLTEGVATFISPTEMAERPDSVGRPCPGMDIRLIDPEGKDVTFAGEGEIVGRSNNLMEGYWNRPELNAEILWQSEQGHHYIRTGDVGEFDRDGYLHIRGRIKDMLISGGINVFPADIESELIQHPNVKDACVIGIPDEKWGETPIAFVQPQGEVAVATEALVSWVNARVSRHQRVSDIILWNDDFPRNTLGKVLKGELKKSWSEGQKP